MPSSSDDMARFMRAVAHGWKPPGRKAPPVSVAREFMRADMAKNKADRNKKRPRKRTMADG